MDSSKTKNAKNNTVLRSQLFIPPLQYGILGQTLIEATDTVKGFVCKDKPGWMSSSGKPCSDYSIENSNCDDTGQDGTTAHDSCMVACNNCPAHIKLVKEEGGTYDRLPSPIEEAKEPNFSSLLTDDNWKIGKVKDISQNPDIPNRLDDIDEKLDELRKNIPEPFCSCSDVKDNLFGPSRCSGADLSDDFKWDPAGKFTYQADNSIDSDDRYKATCPTDYDYTKGVASLNYKEDGVDRKRTLVYNCTSQKWETKGHKRSDPYVNYTFPDGMIHCSSSDPSHKYTTCASILKKVYDPATKNCYRCTNFDDGDKCQVDKDYVLAAGFQGKCKPCLNLLKENNGYKEDIKALCGDSLPEEINKHCLLHNMGAATSSPSPSGSGNKSSPKPKPCSQGTFERIFYDADNCIPTSPSPSATDKNDVTVTEVIIWVILTLLSVICGYLIYNAGGNIPIYLAINLGVTLIYVILRFEI